MSTEANKAVVRRYIEEVVNQGQIDLIDTLFAPAMRERVRGFMSGGDDAFPDGYEEIQDIVAEGNTVMVRWIFRGTHQATFLDSRPPASASRSPAMGSTIWKMGRSRPTP
jgi:predicted ester cyclase